MLEKSPIFVSHIASLMKKTFHVAISVIVLLQALVACGNKPECTTDAIYASVEELFLMGEYREAEERIDSMCRVPSITREERSMVYLLRSRLHQLRDEDPYRATKYMNLHVATMNDAAHGNTTPWVVASATLLLALWTGKHYTHRRKATPASTAYSWDACWEEATKNFEDSTASRLLLMRANDRAFTTEERKELITAIEEHFANVIQRMRREAPTTNREEALYCICAGLRMSLRQMADCLSTTLSTLRSRKSRLRNKLPERMFYTFFVSE